MRFDLDELLGLHDKTINIMDARCGGLSVEGGMGVEDGQGEGAGDAEVEEPDAEEVVEEVVEFGFEAVVSLGEGHSYPDYGCTQPEDVSVHAWIGPKDV